MDRKDSFICVSAIITTSFFSLISEIGSRGVKALLHSSDFYKPTVESEYKPPLYKLWQYVTKDKSSTHNSGVVYFDDKAPPYIQQVLASYRYPPEKLEHRENYTKQSAFPSFKKQLSLENTLLFRKCSDHSIDLHRMLNFFPCIHMINQTLSHVKNILGKCQTYSRRVCCKLNNFTSHYRSAVYRCLRKPHRIGVYTNKIFLYQVYYL